MCKLLSLPPTGFFHPRFLVQEATRFENDGVRFRPDGDRVKNSSNSMDKWIIAATHELIKFVRQEMDAYRLYTVVGGLTHLLEDLTNWYIRLNRDRMKGDNGPEEALTSLCTVYEVLLNVTVMLAPVTPFITEFMYQNLSRALPEGHTMKAQSVHFVMVPDFDSGTSVSVYVKLVFFVYGQQSSRRVGPVDPDCRSKNAVCGGAWTYVP